MNLNPFRHKERNHINPIYGIGALKCNLGLHDYQMMACWAQGTDEFQHDCKRCGHSKWFAVENGKEIGEKMFDSDRK